MSACCLSERCTSPRIASPMRLAGSGWRFTSGLVTKCPRLQLTMLSCLFRRKPRPLVESWSRCSRARRRPSSSRRSAVLSWSDEVRATSTTRWHPTCCVADNTRVRSRLTSATLPQLAFVRDSRTSSPTRARPISGRVAAVMWPNLARHDSLASSSR